MKTLTKTIGRPLVILVALLAAAAFVPAASLSATQPSCKDIVNNVLSQNGYTPSTLSRISGRPASSINNEILSLCSLKIAPPQVAAQVLKDSKIDAPHVGSFLAAAFKLSVTQSAQVLSAVGYNAAARR